MIKITNFPYIIWNSVKFRRLILILITTKLKFLNKTVWIKVFRSNERKCETTLFKNDFLFFVFVEIRIWNRIINIINEEENIILSENNNEIRA